MTPSFFKQIPLQLQLEGELRLVQFAAGFAKAVDPLSGMSINLMKVIQWLEQLEADSQTMKFTDSPQFLQWADQKLRALAQAENATLSKIQIRFFDGSVSILSEGQFIFRKSQESAGRILVIDFEIENKQQLEKAGSFSISTPASLSEIQSKSGLSVTRVEIKDLLQKTCEIETCLRDARSPDQQIRS